MLTTAPIVEAVPTVRPTATPTPELVVVAQEVSHPNELRVAPQSCYDNPDRYNWQKYALMVGFPEEVIPELTIIVNAESGGDLCAVNQGSGASCWIQQLPGGPQFFDPVTCMSQGYAKWLDGGRSFWRHWYQWWGR